MSALRALALVTVLVAGASASAGSYTLRPGDTLARVARVLRVTVPDLAAANGITNVHRVQAGKVLRLPGTPAAAAPAARPAPAPVPGATHKVAAGDTLSAIARRYATTVAELRKRNGLRSADVLREGRTLQLPASAVVPVPVCPVRGATRSDFGDSWGAPRHGGRLHNGNDIFARRGTQVVANVGGRLRHASGALGGLAYYLEGDDATTYYGAHLDALAARAGRVEAGQVLGVVGTTGNAQGTPPHLHFEVKPGGGPPVDPYQLLRSWC